MNKKFSNFLRLLHNCLWLYTLAYFLGDCLVNREAEPGPLFMLPLLPVIVYSFWIYVHSKHLWSYLLLQTPAVIAAIILGGLCGQTAAFVLVVLLMLGCQLMERRSPLFGPLRPCVPMLIFFAATYFLALFYGCPRFGQFAVLGLMADILLLVLYENNEGLYDFLDVRKNIRSMPYRQIRLGNRLMLAGIVTVLLIIFFCTGFFMDNSPIMALASLLMNFMRFLIRKLLDAENVPLENQDLIQPELPENFVEEADGFGQEAAQNIGTSPVWDVVAWCILIALGMLLLAVIIRGVWRLAVAFFSREVQKNEKEELLQDEITDLSEERKKKKAPVLDRGADGQIRKTYRKKIRHKRRENKRRGPVDPAFTPTQIENDSVYSGQVTEEERRSWQELHALYEKERYGRE